jgi:hypothetical protein
MKINNRGTVPIQPGEFPQLPKGRYPFVITRAVEKTTKTKGLPKASLFLEVFNHDMAGQKIWHDVVFIPKGSPGAGFSVHFMHTIGVECNCEKCDPKQALGAEFEPDLMQWIGKCFEGEVVEEMVTGPFDPMTGAQTIEKRTKIQKVFPTDQRPPAVGSVETAPAASGAKSDEEVPF